MNKQIECISNPFINKNKHTNQKNDQAYNFHKTLPGYKPTPLVNLKNYSNQIGIKNCLIKDESKRLGLNAFKVLGASYAMAEEIKSILGFEKTQLSYDFIREHTEAIKDLTFVTATDGNHGRAVAWCADKFGCKAVVFMPKGTSEFRLRAIQKHHAHVEITDVNYDDTVKYAESESKAHQWILLQDSSWLGYENVAKHIMSGYTTMVNEFIEQTPEWPTHVITQAGVGSFAASIFSCFSNRNTKKPKLILLEPSGAACFYNSLKVGDGNPHLTKNLDTIMAGLSCGMPSLLAWDIICSNADFFTICKDSIAIKGMQILAKPYENDTPVISGESGAVPIGFLNEICTNQAYIDLRDDLGLDSDSTVLFFSTEGDTDPDLYHRVVS